MEPSKDATQLPALKVTEAADEQPEKRTVHEETERAKELILDIPSDVSGDSSSQVGSEVPRPPLSPPIRHQRIHSRRMKRKPEVSKEGEEAKLGDIRAEEPLEVSSPAEVCPPRAQIPESGVEGIEKKSESRPNGGALRGFSPEPGAVRGDAKDGETSPASRPSSPGTPTKANSQRKGPQVWFNKQWSQTSTYRSQTMDRLRTWKQQYVTSDEAKATRRKRFDRIKYYLKLFFAHLFSTAGLCALTVCYSVLGAFLFRLIENENRVVEQNVAQAKRQKCANDLWNLTFHLNVLHEENWTRSTLEYLKHFEDEVVLLASKGYSGSNNELNFAQALLYSITVITTIGYGNIAPKTDMGKIFTMLYAVIGVPVMLLCLTNLGNIMAKTFRFSYKKFFFCCSDKSLCANRANGETRVQLQLETKQKALEPSPPSSPTSPRIRDRDKGSYQFSSQDALSPTSEPGSPGMRSKAGSQSSPICHAPASRTHSMIVVTEASTRPTADHTRVPIWLVTLLVIGYIIGGGVMFSSYEQWDFLDGCYFCFITLSTIGFGDLVPGTTVIQYADEKGQKQLIFCCIYLICGLSLLAMSFNLVQEEIIFKCRRVAQRLGILPQRKSEGQVERRISN